MTTHNMSSYTGWVGEGRQVMAGEKARAYHQSEDGGFTALFHLEQTELLTEVDLSVGEIITVEQRQALRKPAKPRRLKLRIEDTEKDGTAKLLIWVGNNGSLIRMMQKAGFKYSGQLHRWIGYRKDVHEVTSLLSKASIIVDLEDVRAEHVRVDGEAAI